MTPQSIQARQLSAGSPWRPASQAAKVMTLALGLLVAGCAGAQATIRTTAQHPGAAAHSAVDPLHLPDVAPPDPVTAQQVSLDELLAYADAHAPRVRVGRQQAALGEAEIEAASPWLQDNPELGAAAGGRRIGSTTLFQLELSLEQRIEIAGERGLRLEAAEATRDLARIDLTQARWEVHAEVHALFYDMLLAKKRLGAADQLVAFAESLHDIADKRARAGDTAPFTLLVAQAELAQARQARVAEQQVGAAAELALAAVVGWPTGRLPELRGSLGPVRRAPALSRLEAMALRHHPVLRGMALALRAADAQVRLEDREAWPEPALGVVYARDGEEAGPATHLWLGTLSVPLPIWQRNQAGRARARAERELTRAEGGALQATLRARLARAAGAVDAAAARVKIFGTHILPAFERNLGKIKRAYDLGEIDIHEVSQIRERVLATQQQGLAALSDYYRAVAELEALLGTDIWPPSGAVTEGDRS